LITWKFAFFGTDHQIALKKNRKEILFIAHKYKVKNKSWNSSMLLRW